MITLKEVLESLTDLFYPVLCIHCGRSCIQNADLFCYQCQSRTSPTSMHNFKDNEFTRHFIGRINIYTGASLYYYTPGGIVHDLLEQIKYRSKPQIAQRIGHYYGRILKENQWYYDRDLVIPVPLHPKKLALRGYNQSAWFGQALAEEMNIEFDANILYRKKNAASLTLKNRQDRIQSLENTYELKNTQKLENRRIILVDDVMTTGSTLEVCAQELLKANPHSISFVTIAMGA